MALAASPLPVPVSPLIKMVLSESATLRISWKTFRICSLPPIMPKNPSGLQSSPAVRHSHGWVSSSTAKASSAAIFSKLPSSMYLLVARSSRCSHWVRARSMPRPKALTRWRFVYFYGLQGLWRERTRYVHAKKFHTPHFGIDTQPNLFAGEQDFLRHGQTTDTTTKKDLI